MKTKRIIFITFLVLIAPLFTLNAQHNVADAQSNKTCYARIDVGNNFGADFFLKTDKKESLFQIPNTYFVLANGIDGEFLEVTYKDLSGLVRVSDVTLVDGTPKKAYPNIPLSSLDTRNIYKLANNTSAISATVKKEDTLTYYGEKVGAGLQNDRDGHPVTTWYYTRTESNNFGYIYINDIANIPNTDRVAGDPDLTMPTLSKDFFSNTSKSSFTGLSLGTQIMLIIAIGVPSLLILYFLIKPTKIMQATKKKSQKKGHKRISHGDYFEFDEKEL